MQLLLLLLLSVCQRFVHSQVSVSPGRSQHTEYDKVSVSCEQRDSEEWTVWRYTTEEQKLSPCGSSWGDWSLPVCRLTVKPSDGGVYWCQTRYSDSSNTVNISVPHEKSSDPPVVLQSPVLPLSEGDDVTLRCRTNKSFNHAAAFYRDDVSISAEAAATVTIHNFSRSDQGAYRCVIGGRSSPTSWLLLEDDSVPASLTASPDSAQLFEYDSLLLRCGDNSSSRGWRVLRASGDRISSCGSWGTPTASGCELKNAKRHDSATYWCESAAKQRSNSVDIAVNDTPVILQSPVLPVAAGQNVTLHCKTKESSRPADFYKDGNFIGRGVEGHMTLHYVSRSDEGLYRCLVSSVGESEPSRLLVRGPRGAASSAERTLLVLTVMRRLLVACPYCIATALMLSVCRRTPSGRTRPVSMAMSPNGEEHDPYDDVDADVTTEHHF